MKMNRRVAHILIYFLLCSTSCSVISPSTPSADRSTPPFPIDEPTPLPLSTISITVTAPAGTPSNADLLMEIFDEVSGWPYNTNILPLTRLSDGRWQLDITPPAGSLLRYRYIRKNPTPSVEAGTDGTAVRYRMLYVPSTAQFQDIIAAWVDTSYEGPTGRIIGRIVEVETGKPLSEMIASIAGQLTFTDEQGNFRVDGLVPGLHNITVMSPDGSYAPAQQGAIIAADSTTPAQMTLTPTLKIQVTFEVALPENIFEEAPLRIAGNIQQFGHLFTEISGGMTNTVSQMPSMIEVDPTHYIQIVDLYAGMDLRYKYTLGDGLQNAECNADGEIFTRQVILPDHDLVIRDAVERWQGQNQRETFFHVIVPAETPATDDVSIQFNVGHWLPPLPMWQIGENEWSYTLYNLPANDSIAYRYCRNQQCGSADDIDTPGPDSPGRPFAFATGQQEINDTVSQWIWWSGIETTLPFEPPQLGSRSDFELGVEILPDYRPAWDPYLAQGFQGIAAMHANTVVLSPSWVVSQNHVIPVLDFDPGFSSFRSNLESHIQAAQQNGLDVIFHPTLTFTKESSVIWWQISRRDENWWTIWFERYKSFILSCAQIAQETGVRKIILGGPEIAPSLPDAQLSDGSSSGAHLLSNSHWRTLISEIRSIYSGSIAFELELSESLQPPPPFLDVVDEVHIYWHTPLSVDGNSAIPEMQVMARSMLNDAVLNEPTLSGKPLVISVEYPSVDRGTTACLSNEDGECVRADIFDQGAYIHPEFQIDLNEQAEALTAVLTEACYQGAIKGFYVRRYNPIVALQDKSASINGKPAMSVLNFLYQRINSP
jgi:hypothetical protein